MSRNLQRILVCILPVIAVLPLACAGGASDEAARRVLPVTAPTWAPWVSYRTGDHVTHGARVYRCIQPHTSQPDWEPQLVPALWADVGPSSDPDSGAGGRCGGGEGGGHAGDSGSAGGGAAEPPGAGGDSGSGGGGARTGGTAGSGTGGGGAGDSGTGGAGTGGAAGTEYAPYFYTWGWGNAAYAFSSLMDLRQKTGMEVVTLAFVLGNSGGGEPCSVTNDGTTNILETLMMEDVRQFRGAGGRVKVSFGGANGLNLDADRACATADALFAALRAFVERTGLTDLDFDVEQNEVLTPTVNAKRSSALARLQRERSDVRVSFTLAALPRDRWNTPGGLLPTGLEVVRSALEAGVRISHVNLMTMDYGSYFSAGQTMSALAASALADAATQLVALIPGLDDRGAWRMLGATPMIGHNDIAGEVFTLDDARALVQLARTRGLGLVSFWAINRDQPCGTDASLAVCSRINTRAFEFHDVFATLP